MVVVWSVFRLDELGVLLIWCLFLFYLSSGILGGSDSNVMDDDQIMLDPNSILGMFVRRCLLTFNQMSFEVIYSSLLHFPIETVEGRTPYLSS